MTSKELQEILAYSQKYGNGTFGGSLIDQYRNANAGLDTLNDMWDADKNHSGISQYDYDANKAGFNASKGKAIAGMTTSILSGASDILGNTMRLGQIGDTSQYENSIRDIRDIGRHEYNDFNQISDAYNRLDNAMPNIDYMKVRGASDGERAGMVGSSILSGATTGMTVGGPWGAAVGAGVGALMAGYGIYSGNEEARLEELRLKNSARLASIYAKDDISAANENLSDYNFRKATKREFGGYIQRMENERFVDTVLRRRRTNDVTRSLGIVRKHCKGGTMIRIKR